MDEIRRSLAEQRADVEYHAVPTSLNAEQKHHVADSSHSWGAEVLDSIVFQHCMGAVILANGVVIGLETDVKEFPYWDPIEAVFLTIFFVEVSFKMYIEGSMFFHPKEADFWWNIFDVLVVGLGVFDFMMSLLGMSSAGSAVSIFRMVRLMRVLRLLRLLKILKRLYLLAVGLVEACKAIVWVTLLMSTVLYVFSIVLVKTIGSPSATDPNYDFLKAHFGTIPDSMISLFVLMSSPNLPIYQEEGGLLDAQPIFCLFLILFICFGSFGMIAMLTGVINESMFENNELKKEEKRELHETMRLSLGQRSADLYESLPLDADGCAKVDDLDQILEPAAQLLDQTGVPIAHGDILRFLQLMDEDESGVVSLSDFVHGMEKISEGLSPLAMVEVQHYVGLCNKKLSRQLQEIRGLSENTRSIVLHVSEEVDRIIKDISKMQDQHRTHLVEKIESQILRISEEVDRILHGMTSEHRSHLAEKIESQMSFTSREADRILQVLTDSDLADVRRCESAVLSAVCKQTEQVTCAVQSVIQLTQKDSTEQRERQEANGCQTAMPAAAVKQPDDLDTAVQSIIDSKFPGLETFLAQEENSKKCTCDSTVLAALSKQTEDLATSVQSIIDKKFSELERKLAQTANGEQQERQTKDVVLAVQSVVDESFSHLEKQLALKDFWPEAAKLLHEASSKPKLDEILSSVQVLKREEDMIESLKTDFGMLMQESKSAVVRVGTKQETINRSIDLLTDKMSVLEREADSAQTQLLNSVAELGGDIISSVSDLVSTSLVAMKQETMAARVNSWDSSREGQRGFDGKSVISPSQSYCSDASAVQRPSLS